LKVLGDEFRLAALAFALVVLAGCDQAAKAPAAPASAVAQPAAKPGVTRAAFGSLPDGTPVEAFTFTNSAGASVTVLDYGGIVTSIRVPDRAGKLDDVVLGYDTLAGYLAEGAFNGAIAGRYANRIGGARFSLDGQTYTLAANNGPNTLHGGVKGFNRVVWHAEPFERAGAAGVVLRHTSPDGDEGFPGTLSVTVTYTFDDRNALAIDYQAVTDKPTVVNLTNHSYFNLGGDGSGDVLAQRLTINAQRYTPVDDTLIPLGELAEVAGTPLDFRTATPIGARIADPGLKPAKGYDHNYVIDRTGPGEVVAARVEDPKSGRTLEVRTTEPGVQLYTANHLDGSKPARAGHLYVRHAAFCLETQHFPDSPNKPAFPTTTLRPGEKFESRTVYAFGVQ
jgi:aldose 1-epimerase